ncbi:MAG: FKBP-type peptidyl-prolyl cis-trans isomerase N-terminal domain-containing protein [Phycisphaerales bacterium]
MRIRTAIALVAASSAVVGVALAQDGNRADVPAPYAPGEAAYSVGYDLGAGVAAQLDADGVDADLDELVRGFTDALRGADPDIDPERMRRILERLHSEVAGRLAAERMRTDPVFRAQAEANAAHGAEVRERFSKRERVVTLPSGVMYEPLRVGDGASAENAETVIVTFETMHADGTPIAGERAEEIRIASLLDGAQALVRQMRIGDRWFILVPPERAYGLGGRDPDIGPNETIVVDIELLGIRQ